MSVSKLVFLSLQLTQLFFDLCLKGVRHRRHRMLLKLFSAILPLAHDLPEIVFLEVWVDLEHFPVQVSDDTFTTHVLRLEFQLDDTPYCRELLVIFGHMHAVHFLVKVLVSKQAWVRVKELIGRKNTQAVELRVYPTVDDYVVEDVKLLIFAHVFFSEFGPEWIQFANHISDLSGPLYEQLQDFVRGEKYHGGRNGLSEDFDFCFCPTRSYEPTIFDLRFDWGGMLEVLNLSDGVIPGFVLEHPFFFHLNFWVK